MAGDQIALTTLCGATPDGRRCGAVRSPRPRRVSADAPRAACECVVCGLRWRRTSPPRCPRRRANEDGHPRPRRRPDSSSSSSRSSSSTRRGAPSPHCGPRAGAASGGCSQQPGGRCGTARCHSGRCRRACLASARLVDATPVCCACLFAERRTPTKEPPPL